jgi:hypothetical protein
MHHWPQIQMDCQWFPGKVLAGGKHTLLCFILLEKLVYLKAPPSEEDLTTHICINHIIMCICYCKQYYTECHYVVVVLTTTVLQCASTCACLPSMVPVQWEKFHLLANPYAISTHLGIQNAKICYNLWCSYYTKGDILDCFTGSQYSVTLRQQTERHLSNKLSSRTGREKR